jgi:hypothetical protein
MSRWMVAGFIFIGFVFVAGVITKLFVSALIR